MKDNYSYPALRFYAGVSGTLSAIVLLVGLWLAFTSIRHAESDGQAFANAAVIAAITIVVAATVGVVADVVRWMHDVVNLLDEHSEYLKDLPR